MAGQPVSDTLFSDLMPELEQQQQPATPQAQPQQQQTPAAPQQPVDPGQDIASFLESSGDAGIASVVRDVATGITELPRAMLKGTRDAVQGTADFVAEGLTAESQAQALVANGGQDLKTTDVEATKAPELPDLDKPKSVTGQFATQISQFVAGMLTVGKLGAGFAPATRVGQSAVAAGQAATVGAIAFDPSEKRLSDLIESFPTLSNPVTQFLSSDPNDSRAMGRLKNAVESLGMDAVVGTALAVGLKVARARKGLQEGTVSPQQFDQVVKQAEAEMAVPAAPKAAESPLPKPAPASPSWEARPEPKPLGPPPSNNYGTSLDRYSNHLYRQTDAAELGAWLPNGNTSMDVQDLYYANTPDLATSQREGSRAMLEIDPAYLRGQINQSKPAWSMAWGSGAAEFRASPRVDGPVKRADALRAVEVPKDFGQTSKRNSSEIRERRNLDRLVEEGSWGVTDKGETLRYYRKGSSSEAPKAADAPPQVVSQTVDVAAPAAPAPKATTIREVPQEQVDNLLNGFLKDADAFEKYGNWENAVADGHRFAGDFNIPWQKFAEPGRNTEIGEFRARLAETLKSRVDEAKGGDVMSDAMVRRAVQRRANLWNEDPAELMGMLREAGENARTMVADMEASFLVSQRAFQDTYTLAANIKAGNLDAFNGNRDEAVKALQQMMGVVAESYGAAQSMRAAAGRSMRRMRSEFVVSPESITKLQSVDPERLVDAMLSTGGNPKNIPMAANPSMWERMQDGAQWLLVNNLLWGPVTHAVNLTTNLYMVGARPLERALGSYRVGGDPGKAIRQESLRQYLYLGSAMVDGWRSAVKAWQLGDSVLTPHNLEATTVGGNLSQQIAQMPFRPITSLSDLIYNAFVPGALKVLGTPTRALGVADEMMKQIVYRSKVSAKAHMEAVEKGLDGDDLAQFVRQKVESAFDAEGRALDDLARDEALRATFQQDLLPGTFGSAVQAATTSWKPLRFVVPFVRTPINVLRTGWQMTPGLNMLQTEYRHMISGKAGPEVQAQAMGQMAMGTLLLGTAAYLSDAGLVTGGGPSDPQQRKRLMDTGWRPYSFVRAMPDGTKQYIQFNRFDPVALPFGIVADLMDSAAVGESDGYMKGAEALLISLAKQLSNKAYLVSINQAVDALVDPDRSFGKFAGQMASNFVPAASALRYANPDPHMRETRDIVDKLMSQTPGLSENLPPRRNVFGEPVVAHKGIVSVNQGGIAEMELERLITESGVSFGPPSPRVHGGVDLRDLKMSDGRNAYDVYQQYAAQLSPKAPTIKVQLERLMQTAAYKNAPDGEPGLKGTKLYLVTGILKNQREAALKLLQRDKAVREEMFKAEREVAAHYKARTSPVNRTSTGLDAIGQAFGLDLSGSGQ